MRERIEIRKSNNLILQSISILCFWHSFFIWYKIFHLSSLWKKREMRTLGALCHQQRRSPPDVFPQSPDLVKLQERNSVFSVAIWWNSQGIGCCPANFPSTMAKLKYHLCISFKVQENSKFWLKKKLSLFQTCYKKMWICMLSFTT